MFKVGKPLPELLEAWAPEEWNIAFLSRSHIEHWSDLVSPEPMRHVVCYGYAARADVWHFFDPSRLGSTSLLTPPEEFAPLFNSICERATVILCRPRGELKRMRLRGLTTCASAVAHMIGFETGAWRPAALYRELHADPLTMEIWREKTEGCGESDDSPAPGRGSGGEVAA